jgi:RES domain-containing protein
MAAPRDPGFSGTVFRQSSPRHAEITNHTLAASSRAGGRFNVGFGAIYLSLDPETPFRELRRHCARAGIDVSALLPRTLFAVEARLQRVLDLTDWAVRAAWSLETTALLGDDWEPCQEVARRARDAGYEAIRFPSATGTGENIAVFLDRLAAGSCLRILREEALRPGAGVP